MKLLKFFHERLKPEGYYVLMFFSCVWAITFAMNIHDQRTGAELSRWDHMLPLVLVGIPVFMVCAALDTVWEFIKSQRSK